MKILFLWISVLLISASCNFKKKESAISQGTDKNPKSHVVTVTDVIQTSNYTYLKLKEGKKEYWAAVSAVDAKPGQTYYYTKGMEMTDFKSKELKRTFNSIWFIENLSENPIVQEKPAKLTTTGRQMMSKEEGIKIEPLKDGVTISELFADKAKFDGKTIKIKGKVIKFSPDIMNKNWVHLQDGTESDGQYDLVVTTRDKVQEGDIVTFEGKISLNKDFGYGYKYDILLEEASAAK